MPSLLSYQNTNFIVGSLVYQWHSHFLCGGVAMEDNASNEIQAQVVR